MGAVGCSTRKRELPKNISFLFDASCGTGVLPSSFPPLLAHDCQCGYAGGIGPKNAYQVLNGIYEVVKAQGSPPVWIDMESSLRSIVDGKDVFNVVKAFDCINEYVRYIELKQKSEDLYTRTSLCLKEIVLPDALLFCCLLLLLVIIKNE